jgi:TonB-linked SusC/RagA family outer membrane protein
MKKTTLLYFLNRFLLFFLFSVTFFHTGYGQGKTVTGIVKDSSGTPLPGVQVIVKDSKIAVRTAADGKFSIAVPDNQHVLVFRYIGLATAELPATGTDMGNIILKPQSVGLQDVVVVGYGVQRKSDLTGAVSSIKAADITKIGGSNAAEALQGKAPGVLVLNVGAPGNAPIVRVRGIGTNGDPNPLYIVDGMFVNDIQYLNSHDIASMEILKDASATAIYGSRGANGVILVTTKKGRPGKAVVNVSGSEGFQFLTRRYDVANGSEYARLQNMITGTNVYPHPDSLGEGTNWFDKSTQQGWVRDYQLSISGGSENTSYNISGGYFKQDGVMKFTDYDRFTLRANNEYRLNKRLKIGHNLSMSNSNTTGIASSSGLRVFNALVRISPLISVYDANGNFNAGQDPDIINPYAALYYGKDANNKSLRFVGNGWLNYEVIPGLVFRSSYGVDYSYDRYHYFEPAYTISSPNQIHASNSLTENHVNNKVWLWENTLTYDKQIGRDHHLNLLGGITAQEGTYDKLEGVGTGLAFDSPDYQYLGAVPAGNLSVTSTAYSESMLSYLFRANYSFKDRYLFTGTFRADGSSKFGPDNRYGYFPSLALGWRVSEENFMQRISWIDNLKLRASWGQVGNNKINNYIAYSTVTQDPVYNALFNGQYAVNGTVTNASNPAIKWERTVQTDAGIEFGTLNKRLNVEFDYFNRDTKDLLLIIPIPGGSAGITPTYSNVGSIRNRGIEFLVNWNDHVGDFNYGIRFSGSTYKNTVLDFGGQIISSTQFLSSSVHRGEKGQPIGYFYGYKTIGIFQSQAQISEYNGKNSQGKEYQANAKPGDLIYADTDGNGYITGNDQTNIGSPHPKFIGGLTLTASYKSFDFAIDLMGSFGAKIYNTARNQITTTTTNLHKDWLRAWTPTNTNTDMPRLAANSNNSWGSSFNVQDGTYGKIRNVELGYNMQKSLLNKVKISNLRIYVNLTNPLYITRYKGFSPEIANANVLEMGTDFSTYPVSGTARIGVNMTL